jgi:hypothetical protein
LQAGQGFLELIPREEPLVDQQVEALLNRGGLVGGEEIDRLDRFASSFTEDFNEETQGVIVSVVTEDIMAGRVIDSIAAHREALPCWKAHLATVINM